MQIKYKRIISYFLIALMLFSGMFYENIMEDSLFDRTTVTHSTPFISPSDNKLTDTTACTIEMLGVRTISYVQQFANKSSQKTAIKTAFDSPVPDYIWHNLFNFFITVRVVQFRTLHSQTVLVNYIHNKDGKKYNKQIFSILFQPMAA